MGEVILCCPGTVSLKSQKGYLSKEALIHGEEQSRCCASNSFDGN